MHVVLQATCPIAIGYAYTSVFRAYSSEECLFAFFAQWILKQIIWHYVQYTALCILKNLINFIKFHYGENSDLTFGAHWINSLFSYRISTQYKLKLMHENINKFNFSYLPLVSNKNCLSSSAKTFI